jgi:hypothetical protein
LNREIQSLRPDCLDVRGIAGQAGVAVDIIPALFRPMIFDSFGGRIPLLFRCYSIVPQRTMEFGCSALELLWNLAPPERIGDPSIPLQHVETPVK